VSVFSIQEHTLELATLKLRKQKDNSRKAKKANVEFRVFNSWDTADAPLSFILELGFLAFLELAFLAFLELSFKY
jgi:hypothetical protein